MQAALLSQIRDGKSLKKVLTNDRSTPLGIQSKSPSNLSSRLSNAITPTLQNAARKDVKENGLNGFVGKALGNLGKSPGKGMRGKLVPARLGETSPGKGGRRRSSTGRRIPTPPRTVKRYQTSEPVYPRPDYRAVSPANHSREPTGSTTTGPRSPSLPPVPPPPPSRPARPASTRPTAPAPPSVPRRPSSSLSAPLAPPPPPRPSMTPLIPSPPSSSPAETSDRSALLSQIQLGTKLRKAETDDRSTPSVGSVGNRTAAPSGLPGGVVLRPGTSRGHQTMARGPASTGRAPVPLPAPPAATVPQVTRSESSPHRFPPPPTSPSSSPTPQTDSAERGGHSALLHQIQKGTELRKSVINDRSAPSPAGSNTKQLGSTGSTAGFTSWEVSATPKKATPRNEYGDGNVSSTPSPARQPQGPSLLSLPLSVPPVAHSNVSSPSPSSLSHARPTTSRLPPPPPPSLDRRQQGGQRPRSSSGNIATGRPRGLAPPPPPSRSGVPRLPPPPPPGPQSRSPSGRAATAPTTSTLTPTDSLHLTTKDGRTFTFPSPATFPSVPAALPLSNLDDVIASLESRVQSTIAANDFEGLVCVNRALEEVRKVKVECARGGVNGASAKVWVERVLRKAGVAGVG